MFRIHCSKLIITIQYVSVDKTNLYKFESIVYFLRKMSLVTIQSRTIAWSIQKIFRWHSLSKPPNFHYLNTIFNSFMHITYCICLRYDSFNNYFKHHKDVFYYTQPNNSSITCLHETYFFRYLFHPVRRKMVEYQSCAAIVPENDTSKQKSLRYRRIRANIAYFIFGICNNFGYVVMLTAAADIISEQIGASNHTVSILFYNLSGHIYFEVNYLNLLVFT